MVRGPLVGVLALLLLLAGCAGGPDGFGGEASPSTEPSPTAPMALAPALAARLLGPWSATPLDLPPDAVAIIDRACRGGRENFVDGLVLLVVDARGQGLLQAYYGAQGAGTTSCLDVTVDADGQFVSTGFGTGSDPSEPLPEPGPSGLQVVHHTAVGDTPHVRTQVAGVAGSGIAEVRIDRPGEPPIVASLSNGWFAAWVPGSFGLATIRGYDANGSEVAAIEL